ncbi:hypothetical protein [Haliangium sp.]|uniref:hypothetical protein n=1 Tax=Haliangium sp. TaxID=2663208 RepID=UPI003D0ABD19
MRTPVARAVATAAVLAGLAGLGGCLPGADDIETRVSQVCVRGLVPFEGRVGTTVTSTVTLADVGLDADTLGTLDGAEVTLERLVITPGPGIRDFDFVSAVEIDLAAGGAPPDLRLLERAGMRGAELIDVPPAPEHDLAPHLRSERAALALAFSGDLPRTPWSIELDACLAVYGAE